MNEACETLKSIGIQKIHEDTHISRADIEALIDERYHDLNKVQLLGFVSILQREYGVDLSGLKNNALAYYRENEVGKNSGSGVFVVAKKAKNSSPIYVVIIVVIFLVAVLLSVSFNSKEDVVEVQSVENRKIQEVKKEIESSQLEENVSDVNSSTFEEDGSNEEELVIEEKVEEVKLQAFTIKAKSKVWIGYIDVETNKKYTKTLKETLVLNRDSEWILILGHSAVLIRANGIDYKFSSKKQLRLHYKDGVITRITAEEFKKLNRGRKW